MQLVLRKHPLCVCSMAAAVRLDEGERVEEEEGSGGKHQDFVCVPIGFASWRWLSALKLRDGSNNICTALVQSLVKYEKNKKLVGRRITAARLLSVCVCCCGDEK